MAISNELSSEIATAMLTAKERSPEELTNLKQVLLEVHDALQSMTEEYRTKPTQSGSQSQALQSDRGRPART